MAIFFSLTTHQNKSSAAHEVAKKKELFSPRSASVVEWVLGNIRIFILQTKISRNDWNVSYSKSHCAFLPCYAVNALAIALIKCKKTTAK